MNTHFKRLILTSSVALAVASTALEAAVVPSAQDVVDARQETQIWTTFALNPYLRANDLQVSVRQGKATLTGSVEEGVNKELAEEIALGVTGVTEVENGISVADDYVAPARSTARTYGDVIDDSTITAVIKSKLAWSRYASGLKTKVVTVGGRVVLSGSADSGESRELAGRLAQNSHGVVAVDNRLVVSAPAPALAEDARQTVKTAGQEAADTWITAKVKSTLLYSTHVEGRDIEVSTHDGVVTLSGRAGSGAQRALAIELATNIRGVRSVVSTGLVI
ncbi:MAG: BON domain-containing protein [Gammaproteobacteria bacterium]